MSGQVILLLDEIHRLDKAKQDFLLPHLENGKIVLIGATTSNPYHAINPLYVLGHKFLNSIH